MSFVNDILANKAITVPAIAWFIAQLIKVVCVIVTQKRVDFKRFVGSGGMPSSHSSFIVSLAVVIGKNHGWDSLTFGMAVAIALIVMYDAAGVRRAAGKQAEVLNKLIFEHDFLEHFDERLKELLGHSPLEVIMGALLGICLGLWMG